MDRHILCLHIPSFGIALAQTREASLRQRPVVLAPVHTPRALVREVSFEAAQEGIHSGMAVELARRLCPTIRVVPPDASLTRAAHRDLQQTIQSFAPKWESIRPGSLFLDLSGTQRLLGHPVETAARLERELTVKWGWHGMIGLAANKLVSQLAATTLEQPPQLLSIDPGSEPQFLAPLPATLLPGLNRAQASHLLYRLDDLNLRTLGSIADVSLAQLESVFGTAAGLLHDWALGIDPSPVRPPVEQPMIEQSLTLNPDDIDDPLILGRLYGLLERICATLRQQRRVCRRLSLAIRHSDQAEQAAQQTLPQGTCWEADLQPVLAQLFMHCFRRRVRLQRIILRAERLEPSAEQLLLFDESAALAEPAPHRLSLALDAIREKFGERAVSWGRTLR
jgi:DNA polymerase-4